MSDAMTLNIQTQIELTSIMQKAEEERALALLTEVDHRRNEYNNGATRVREWYDKVVIETTPVKKHGSWRPDTTVEVYCKKRRVAYFYQKDSKAKDAVSKLPTLITPLREEAAFYHHKHVADLCDEEGCSEPYTEVYRQTKKICSWCGVETPQTEFEDLSAELIHHGSNTHDPCERCDKKTHGYYLRFCKEHAERPKYAVRAGERAENLELVETDFPLRSPPESRTPLVPTEEQKALARTRAIEKIEARKPGKEELNRKIADLEQQLAQAREMATKMEGVEK